MNILIWQNESSNHCPRYPSIAHSPPFLPPSFPPFPKNVCFSFSPSFYSQRHREILSLVFSPPLLLSKSDSSSLSGSDGGGLAAQLLPLDRKTCLGRNSPNPIQSKHSQKSLGEFHPRPSCTGGRERGVLMNIHAAAVCCALLSSPSRI